MIIANARQVLADARLRRSSEECDAIAQSILSRAAAEMGARFSNVEKIVDNRNSLCLKLYDDDRPYLLKINKNPNTREVTGSAGRMNAISEAATQDAFSVPTVHYLDQEFDATIMDFVPGTRLDAVFTKSADPYLVQDRLHKAAAALAFIHGLSPDNVRPAVTSGSDKNLAELATLFPSFSRRNSEALGRLAALPPLRPVFLHGDFSPKNLIFDDTGNLFVIDFANVADSPSPLRDISIFAIGLARAITLAARGRPVTSERRTEALVQDFLARYHALSPQFETVPETLSQQLVLFELLRLAETKTWLDGYRAFDETLLGWVKARLGQRFIASQLRRLESRLK